MPDDKLKTARDKLKPYDDKLARLYGPEFERSSAFESILNAVAKDDRPVAGIIADLGSPI
ncbi:MAG: hypothetical protein V4474_01410 [Patescibacteria group bacterium]